MGINEQEALARQLQAIYSEAYGNRKSDDAWEDGLRQREAWIQVAQFVEKYKNRPSWMTEKQLNEANEMYKSWGYGIPDHK